MTAPSRWASRLGSPMLVVATAAMTVLLVLLTLLQFHWVGEVTVAARERMRPRPGQRRRSHRRRLRPRGVPRVRRLPAAARRGRTVGGGARRRLGALERHRARAAADRSGVRGRRGGNRRGLGQWTVEARPGLADVGAGGLARGAGRPRRSVRERSAGDVPAGIRISRFDGAPPNRSRPGLRVGAGARPTPATSGGAGARRRA